MTKIKRIVIEPKRRDADRPKPEPLKMLLRAQAFRDEINQDRVDTYQPDTKSG